MTNTPTRLTGRDLEMRARLMAAIDKQDAARGRPLTDREKLDNLHRAIFEDDEKSEGGK